MAKLHELLAVSSNLKGQADKTRGELSNTFDKKRHLFSEKVVTFKSNVEGTTPVTEEQSSLQSTVGQELTWISKILGAAVDAAYQIAEANMVARADVVLDNGDVLLKGVPATALLELTKRATEVQTLIAAVPTLDPAKGFELDAQRPKGVYQARQDVKTRTKKTQRAITLYEATKEHPAQVQLISEDQPTGFVTTQEWSGLITPAQKATMHERIEEVIRALKKALARANNVDVDTSKKIGDTLFAYVLNS
jgi:hypothetical protein